MLKELPRYECLLDASQHHPTMEPSACEAFLNLLRTGDGVFEAEGKFLAEHGISHGRFTVLMLLSRTCGKPATTPAELAEESGVTRATISGLLDTLEKDGLAVRETDAHDRRVVRVQLTTRGHKLMAQVLPGYFERVSTMLNPLSEDERHELVALLQKIQQGLQPTVEAAGVLGPASV